MYMENKFDMAKSTCSSFSDSFFGGWLVGCLGLTALSDRISVCIRPSPRESGEEERSD